MKIKIVASAHHRNGIGGAPFHAILFEDGGHSARVGVAVDQVHVAGQIIRERDLLEEADQEQR